MRLLLTLIVLVVGLAAHTPVTGTCYHEDEMRTQCDDVEESPCDSFSTAGTCIGGYTMNPQANTGYTEDEEPGLNRTYTHNIYCRIVTTCYWDSTWIEDEEYPDGGYWYDQCIDTIFWFQDTSTPQYFLSGQCPPQ